MILRLKMILSVVPYERKNIISFLVKFFLIIAFHQFFKEILKFHKLWLIFSGKIFSITLLFPIMKMSKKSSNMFIFKKK